MMWAAPMLPYAMFLGVDLFCTSAQMALHTSSCTHWLPTSIHQQH